MAAATFVLAWPQALAVLTWANISVIAHRQMNTQKMQQFDLVCCVARVVASQFSPLTTCDEPWSGPGALVVRLSGLGCPPGAQPRQPLFVLGRHEGEKHFFANRTI